MNWNKGVQETFTPTPVTFTWTPTYPVLTSIPRFPHYYPDPSLSQNLYLIWGKGEGQINPVCNDGLLGGG